MNIYQRRNTWRLILVLTAIMVVLLSLLYTNYLSSKLAEQEKKEVELFAKTWQKINEEEEDEELTFLTDILISNKTIPIITVDDQGSVINSNNLTGYNTVVDSVYVAKRLAKMQKGYAPIEIPFPDGTKQFIYYQDSRLLNQLKFFPYVQLGIIALFLAVAYYLFNRARQSEQNQVWIGMSKETAHQLGTPISSLMAWVEHLKTVDDEKVRQYLPEIEKDVSRLELITDRFSKIGAKPKLDAHNISDVVKQTVDYIRHRAARNVDFQIETDNEQLMVPMYPQLFNWVLENLLKNSLDAMDGSGSVNLHIMDENKRVIIDVRDTGKGISGSNKNVVFRPGYSTKKRGWGLGLSLSKRIIEAYHKGKIFVKESYIGKGTTFRIILPKM